MFFVFFFHLSYTLDFITDHSSFLAVAPRKLRAEFVATFSSFTKLTISLRALDPSLVFSSFLVFLSVGCFHQFFIGLYHALFKQPQILFGKKLE